MNWDIEAERELWADRCATSFWYFAREAYGIANNPLGGWLTESIHKPLCDWFQGHVEEWLANRAAGRSGQKNLIILIPREFGKTTLITNAGLLWLQVRNPELSIYIGSENVDRAVKFFQPLKAVLKGDDPYQKFSWFYGSWYHKDRMWSNEALIHAVRQGVAVQDPSFGVWGVATGLTGAHPDVIDLDDPTSYERMESHGNWLDVVNAHTVSLIPVLKGDGLRIFIGTRYGDGDHFGTVIRANGLRSVSGMPYDGGDVRDDGIWDLYFLAGRDHKGVPTFPRQWSEQRLKEFEQRESLKYHAQIMNDPATGGHVALTRRQVDELWVSSKDVPRNLRISLHADTAFKYRDRTARGDESVITKWGHARDGSGDLYFLGGWGSNSWRVEQFNDQLVMQLQELKKQAKWPFVLTDEQEVGGKAGTWEITIQSWCHAVGLPRPRILLINRGGKRKILRLIEAASFWVDGKVKLVEGAPGVERLIDQMLKIGNSAHDDWADCAADVFHKEVYMPMRLGGKDEQPEIQRPYDEQLQSGRLNAGIIRDLYQQQNQERAPYAPID